MTNTAPERIETERLILERPVEGDVADIFDRYASDADVVTYLSFPRHRSPADTRTFLAISDREWAECPAGPYLIRSRADGLLIGSTGLSFETKWRAMTGYVLAKDSWGRGYATEALTAMVALARRLDVVRLYALCHPAHRPSQRVLDKCGFVREGTWQRHSVFPNLDSAEPVDTHCYTIILGK
jgi:ribosomal-protein-alanine N-acetyltransferase